MTTARNRDLTLRDKLSRLTYVGACRLLGPEGKRLLLEGGRSDLSPGALHLDDRQLVARLGGGVVRIALSEERPGRLTCECGRCQRACAHLGAVLSLVLEEKMSLGLAVPPRERKPVEALGEDELVGRALADREERAREERMTLRAVEPKRLWSDYTITSAESGKTYRLALRGAERGQSFCSCPDFRKNTLGTCKHVIHALTKLRRRFGKRAFSQPYRRRGVSVYLRYADELELRVALPSKPEPRESRLLKPLADGPIRSLPDLLERVRKLERGGTQVSIHPDAEQYIDERLMLERLGRTARKIRENPAQHPLRKTLLRAELRPYQLDGIAFAIGAGRAVLADDMGLGKTIQAIGAAELLVREVGIGRVLIICPASVKAQWREEIERFTGREAQIVLGRAEDRVRQYAAPALFTICNYEQVLRDILPIEHTRWDLIVLDEGQRIKNWEAKTSQVVKSLRSRFALVLTGTPLENRVDDLYSIVEFIDDRRLAPPFGSTTDIGWWTIAGRCSGTRTSASCARASRPSCSGGRVTRSWRSSPSARPRSCGSHRRMSSSSCTTRTCRS